MTPIKKPRGTYPLSNNCGILIYDIDYAEDKVLASYVYMDNEVDRIWCDITFNEVWAEGFYYMGIWIPFDEVMRV